MRFIRESEVSLTYEQEWAKGTDLRIKIQRAGVALRALYFVLCASCFVLRALCFVLCSLLLNSTV